MSGVGTNRKSGLCDFWVNCGFNQRKQCDIRREAYFTGAETDPEFVVNFANHQRSYDHVRCPVAYANQLRLNCVHGVDCPECAIRKCPPDIIDSETTAFIFGHECDQESNFFVNNSNIDFCS